MSAASPGLSTALEIAPSRPRAFLNIARHGVGPSATYVLTYHRLDRDSARPKPALAEGAQSLIDLLERIGVDFRLKEVRNALEDVLRFGSANIPDLWLSDEEIIEKGLVET
jgi:hypothetical protein